MSDTHSPPLGQSLPEPALSRGQGAASVLRLGSVSAAWGEAYEALALAAELAAFARLLNLVAGECDGIASGVVPTGVGSLTTVEVLVSNCAKSARDVEDRFVPF